MFNNEWIEDCYKTVTSEILSKEILEEWDWESGKPTGRSVTRGESYKKGICKVY